MRVLWVGRWFEGGYVHVRVGICVVFPLVLTEHTPPFAHFSQSTVLVSSHSSLPPVFHGLGFHKR